MVETKPKFDMPEGKKEASSSERLDFGFSGAAQKRKLEADIGQIETKINGLKAGDIAVDDFSPEMRAELSELENQLEEKQLEREVFLQEHDNAGAFKMKRFNEGFMEMFDEEKIKIAEDGLLKLDPAVENRRMAVVNVGELARFNKEGGGHKAGDKILVEAVRTIEKQVMETLKKLGREDVSYNIYRFSGNEYMVDIDDIDFEDMRRLSLSLGMERPSIEGVEEPAPLSVSQTGFSEMVEAYNKSWDDFRSRETEQGAAQLPDDKTIRRDSYGIMKDIANYGLDVEKFATRANRVQNKIDELGVDGAKPFFDNYMKKMFADSEMQNLEDFVGKSDLEVYDIAFEWASKMLGMEKEKENMIDEIAEAFANRILERRRTVELPDKFVYASGEEVPLADVPKQTSGQIKLAKAQEKEDAAEKAHLEKPEDKQLEHERNMARLENRLVKARRDQGTGLQERGVYYNDLKESLKSDKDASIVFVDMGFLKYFDQAGGREVGDSALKLAADLMEQAVDKAELDATVYRYGGDEYTVRINGGQDEVARFNAELHKLTKNAGAVPAGKAGHERGYYPTPLEFNYGATDTARLDEAMSMLEEAGYLEEGERDNLDLRADIMTTIADKMIETQKAVKRFGLLLKQLDDDRYWSDEGDEDYKKHCDKLIEFSDKGIFGESGGRDKLMAWSKELRSGSSKEEEVRYEIMEWVGERIAESRDDSDTKKSAEDLVVEQMVRESYRKQLDQAAARIRQREENEQKYRQDEDEVGRLRGQIEGL